MTMTLWTTDQVMHISGQAVRVRVRGDGPPLLLINGLGANISMWEPLLEALEGFQLVTFDAPGTGGSKAPFLPYPLSRIADIAAEVLDELGHDQVDVLGYSLGGGVAQELARRHPERLRRLVLVSTSCGTGAIPGALRALLAVTTPARHYIKSGHRVAMKMVTLAPAEQASERLRGQSGKRQQEAPPTVRGYMLQMNAFARFGSLPWLQSIEQPTLLVSGTHDRLVPIANSALLAAHLPNARLHIADQWGHYLLQDPASGAAAAIADFLSAETVTESAAWRSAQVVDEDDLAEFVASAPRSAHPARFVNNVVRSFYPVKQRIE